jgi:hypothetical protein
MLTAHSYSAAYVKAQQRPEQPQKPHSPTYEPVCLDRWAWSVMAMDDTINDKEQVK